MRVRQDLESFMGSCFDIIFTLNEIVQLRMREGKHTYAYAFF